MKTSLFLVILFLLCAGAHAQFPVRVQVNVIQPVPPYLPQIKADIAGNRAGLLNQDISSHLSIILTAAGQAQLHIKLSGTIERVAPSPMGVSLRPDYQPAQPIIMGPQLPMVSLTRDMLQSAFGNFSENALVWNNLDLNTLRQNGIDYKLPEGTYRVCVTAYDYDKPGFSAPLSAPGTGCAYFTICYTASAPQLIQPVSTMTQSNSQFQDFVPHTPQIQFIWTPPATTCGLSVGALNYDLEIRRVFEGQTVTDAQSNPYVFHQQNIPTTTFLLDTLKYPHILVPGQKYTIRVRANFLARVGSPLEIANQGYSQIGAIAYQPTTGVALPPGGFVTQSYTPPGACPAGKPLSNTTDLTTGLTGQDLTIGSFALHVDQATANSNGSYKGTGYVTWHPFAGNIRLKISFDSLRVNTDKAVYAGTAYTSTDGSHPEWAPFGLADPIAKLTGLDNSSYEAIRTRISDGAHIVNQILGNDEVDFPLGLNTTIGTTPVTLAIMGISFQPSCTNMNALFNINCPDLGGWLSLGGTGFQIDPNKVLLTGKGGVLYLPQDHQLSMAGMTFKFDGCPGTGTSSIDTSKGTYVQWNDATGLTRIVANADLQFTGSSSLVAVDKNDQRLTDPAAIHTRFDFSDWNDWIASATPATGLEIGALPGFMITSTGGTYDHSVTRNPDGLTFPAGYAGGTGADWQGLFIKDLTMQLPSGLTGNNNTSFGFHNFLVDNSGVTTLISADNILKISTGNLGGWAFSIDHIGIGIVQDNFQTGMQMTGGIRIPLSDNVLAYTCNLSVGEGSGLNYQFAVTPKGSYNIDMWAATLGLQENSSLTITNNSGQFVINARLNGDVTINTGKLGSDVPNVDITALSFQGMTITNNDPSTHRFGFDPGNWSFGGKRLPGISASDPLPASLAGGPSVPWTDPTSAELAPDSNALVAPNEAPAPFAGSSQSSADGFSLNFTGFKPYVKFPASTDNEADIGVTFTMNAVLDESGLGIGGAATMDVFGKVHFPKGKQPVIDIHPNIQLDSIAIDCNLDLFHVDGSLAFKRDDKTFGNDVKGHLDLKFLGTIEVDAAAIFGHVNGYNYWGLAATTYWPQGIMFPPGLSLNGLGGGFHYNMGMSRDVQKMVTKDQDVSSPDAIISGLTPQAGTLGFDAQAILAYLGPNVICLEPTLAMDFSSSHGLEQIRFSGNAEILSSSPPNAGTGIINATAIATYIPNPMNFNCTIGVTSNLPVISINVPVQFNVGDGGNYLYIGTPAPAGTDFKDPAINSMVVVQMGFDAAIVHANMAVYGYFDIGTQLPTSPYIPPAIQHAQDHDGNSMAQGVIDKFSNMLASLQTTNDNSHNTHGTVNNPGFMLGAGIHFDAGLDLVVVSANGSLDIGFAALLEHFDPSEVPSSCSSDGTIGFNNWYAMAIFYADLSAELDVGPFSVGSVNAGAVLTAGLVNPTWGSGDIWIDVSCLGVIDFTGNTSISFGNPCSIQKDPLDNLDMIGDFGPRTRNGDPVDVTSLPYVIGNVPLNTDYTVMTNTGEMRTYQFRVDAYDVTNGNNVPLGGANKVNNGQYEVDVHHTEMLCGNATYNAHIRVSAYQVNGSNPSAALVTQDTTFSFTTGPRPQTILANNLMYSYPLANQRYLLKNEFNSQGRLAVAQDVGYLLTPGKPDDCSSTASPSGNPSTGNGSSGAKRPVTAQLNNAPKTQLLAKFIPSGGGDTLQTSFSYSYNQQDSTGILQFPLPANLQNNKVYSMQIWVVPPPAARNDAIVSVNKVDKTLSRTITQYTMNPNGNLEAKQVPIQVTETNNVRTLSGTRQMANADTARVIFSLAFGTSQYNRFADKMAAYGSAWSTQDENSFALNMPIYSAAANAEPFDEFEIKNFNSTCTANGYGARPIPHLFGADVPWDPNAHNDKDAGLIYVYAAGITSLTHATADLGAPETRGWFGVPTYNLMSLDNMPYQPKLSLYGAGLKQQINTTLPAGAQTMTTTTSGASSGNKQFMTTYINNSAYQLPFAGASTTNTPKAPSGLLWKRDYYFYDDYTLLKNFVTDLSTKTGYINAQTAIDLAIACHSCVVEKVAGAYGSITLTAEGWSQVMSSDQSLFWQDVNNFLSAPWTAFPPTARRPLHFTYNFPCADCNIAPAQASSVFNYKSVTIVTAQAQTRGTVNPNITTQTATNKTPPISNSSQAKQYLSTKYKIQVK